ncbi:hypothetical protein BD779DRAFT_1526926 [Infundibulicybe gibba]|nr:hypothetical protein BD779DRAFT_1526926 [Infundibulicybe gibba]
MTTDLNNGTVWVANRGTQTPPYGLPAPVDWPHLVISVSKSRPIIRSPKPLPFGYLLHYPINILIHIFWLASRRDISTIIALSCVSRFFHEVCKPLMPSSFTLSRATYITNLLELGSAGAQVKLYRELTNIPDMGRIQKLQGEYPSKLAIHAERSLYGRSYSNPRSRIERKMCDRETQVEVGDLQVPSWSSLVSARFIRRPQPPPRGYLLDYPIDLLTHIFGLVCIDDLTAARSLCLVSKGFYMAVKPVMFYWIHLKELNQALWLAHLVSVDVTARVGIRRLIIDTFGLQLEKALRLEELDWNERDNLGSFRWDSSYWGDPDAEYASESEGSEEPEESYDSGSSDESEESHSSVEKMDIEQDMAFFASSEGKLRGNLVYGPGEELTVGEKWPWDDGLQKAKAFINNTISDILHTVAPVLWNLELISKNKRLSVTLPIFPELSELTIRITLLHFLRAHHRVLFPALKCLRIQGRLRDSRINLDYLIHHAPSITEMHVPFDERFLRTLIGKLATPSPHVAPKGEEERRFVWVERVFVSYDPYDEVLEVFEPDEPLFATWDRVNWVSRQDKIPGA